MNIIIVAINWLSHNTMRAGDQKLMIDLECPKLILVELIGAARIGGVAA